MNKVFAAFLYGDAIVLTDGDARPVLVNTKGFDKRSTAEPENERVLSGPREGFTECFMPNLALHLPPRERPSAEIPGLCACRQPHATPTRAWCYIAGLCENSLVERLETRLTALDIDSVLDSNYLAERIRDHRWSPFPTLGTTESTGRCRFPYAGGSVRHCRGRQSGSAHSAVSVSGVLSVQRRLLYQLSAGESFAHPACHRDLYSPSRFPPCTPH